MPRHPQKQALKGSQKWLQAMVASRPGLLDPGLGQPLEWLSPRAADAFAEYQDAAFLDLLGLSRLAPGLADFWPARGPVWDGLAMSGATVVLVEAKSHVGEFLSPPTSARAPGSVSKIGAAFDRTRSALGADARADWSRTFFQYANRLAHLWWLREQGIDARLLFVSFLNDAEQRGPTHRETWQALFRAADYALGLPRGHGLGPSIHHVFPDVSAVR